MGDIVHNYEVTDTRANMLVAVKATCIKGIVGRVHMLQLVVRDAWVDEQCQLYLGCGHTQDIFFVGDLPAPGCLLFLQHQACQPVA